MSKNPYKNKEIATVHTILDQIADIDRTMLKLKDDEHMLQSMFIQKRKKCLREFRSKILEFNIDPRDLKKFR